MVGAAIFLHLSAPSIEAFSSSLSSKSRQGCSGRTPSSTSRLYYHYFSGKNNHGQAGSSDKPVFTVPPPETSIPPLAMTTTPPKSNRQIAQDWEREIQESAVRNADWKTLQTWLEETENNTAGSSSSSGWKVALASAGVVGLGCEYVTHSEIVSGFVAIAIFWMALKDPMEDSSEALVGPLARILGRTTIDSYQKVQPKLKAMARAALESEDAILQLKSQVHKLQLENQELRVYQFRREWIDAYQSQYSLEQDLKPLAQRYQIRSISTLSKGQLMMRLLEVGALHMSR